MLHVVDDLLCFMYCSIFYSGIIFNRHFLHYVYICKKICSLIFSEYSEYAVHTSAFFGISCPLRPWHMPFSRRSASRTSETSEADAPESWTKSPQKRTWESGNQYGKI